MRDLACISYWLPRIDDAGLPIPQTVLVTTDCQLVDGLDGVTPDGFDEFIRELEAAARHVMWSSGMFFLRTGQTSDKHQWKNTCFASILDLPVRVGRLVEFSECADFLGLPTNVWACRRLLEVEPVAVLPGFADMPLVREWRLFASEKEVTHVQPYWPLGAVLQGGGTQQMHTDLYPEPVPPALAEMAVKAAKACGGEWSVDFLEDNDGRWWLTDMAPAACSFKYDPATGESNEDL